jgi:hypothetical protein
MFMKLGLRMQVLVSNGVKGIAYYLVESIGKNLLHVNVRELVL